MSGTFRTGEWRRSVGEFFVIVVGVLTALGVDSIASSVRDRSMQDEYLDALVVELAADTMLLARLLGATESTTTRALELRALLEDPDLERDGDQRVVMTLLQVTGDRRVPLNDATYLDLVNTGNLRLIRDMALRADIVRYYKTSQVLPASLDRTYDRTAEVRSLAFESVPVELVSTLYAGSAPTPEEEDAALSAMRGSRYAERAIEAFLRDAVTTAGLLDTHKRRAAELLSRIERVR